MIIRTEASLGTVFKIENLKALLSKLLCKKGLNLDTLVKYSSQSRVQSVQTSWPHQLNTRPFSTDPAHLSTESSHSDSQAAN
jgi:hypothetical protein